MISHLEAYSGEVLRRVPSSLVAQCLVRDTGILYVQSALSKEKPFGLNMEDHYGPPFDQERTCTHLPKVPSRTLGKRVSTLALAPRTARSVRVTPKGYLPG